MRGQCNERNHSGKYRVPVENAIPDADAEVRPKRLEEVPVRPERYATNHVAQSRAEKDAQQNARYTEDDIEESLPNWIMQMMAEFDTDSTQHKQPEHQHQRQVEAAEARGIQKRKCEVKSAS